MIILAVAFASLAAAEPRLPIPEAAAKVVAEPLRDAMLERLPLDGGAPERAALDGMVARLLEAPTGRELAGAFASRNEKVQVSFQEFPGTAVYEREPGVKVFASSKAAAHALRTEAAASVTLNRACVEVEGAAARDLCAAQLAHELFGHVLGWVEAGPAVRKAYWLYDDELLARLIGWNVTLELTGRVLDPEAYCAAEDPKAEQARLPAVYPSSAWGLTRAELRDPAEALRAHRLIAPEDMRGVIDGELEYFADPAAGVERLAAARAASADALFDRLEARFETLRARLLASPAVFRADWLCATFREAGAQPGVPPEPER